MANEAPDKTKTAKALPITAAAEFLGMKPQYVRTLIRKGKFKPNRVKVREDSEVWRWEIPIDQLKAYQATSGTRTRRADGRSKYTMYATQDELSTIQKLVADSKLGVLIDRAYKPKPKPEATDTES